MKKGAITTNFRQSLGKMGERIARQYLVDAGWTIERCNFYAHRSGEVDIIAKPPKPIVRSIAKRNEELVFIEVKTRHESCNQEPALEHSGQQAVHRLKQNRIKHSAVMYMRAMVQANNEAGKDTPFYSMGFDLLLVDVHLNYPDLKELVELQDVEALRPHCGINHLRGIMGEF